MSKVEEKIKKILNDHMYNNTKNINEQIGGIFLYGFITGIIASYSGLLSYLAGISTGIILSKKYDYISCYISKNAVDIFQYVNKQVFNN